MKKPQLGGSSTSLLLPLRRGATGDSTSTTLSFVKRTATRSWRFVVDVNDTFSCSRLSVLTGAILAFATCASNVILTVWAISIRDTGDKLFIQDCDKIEFFNTAIHLVFNVLSTLLLGASNFAMQVLCAPTRAELEKAHRRGQWLDIGIQSPRNLTHVSWRKVIIWIGLALSSIPLHLL
jgi:hypothetical protein